MNDKIEHYLTAVFAPYEGIKSVSDLKADLLTDLLERFNELKAEGKDDETAYAMTIDSIGDIEQTVQEVANVSRSLERKVLISFSASNLPKSDFANVSARQRKFDASDLRGSNFSGADLTGSSFKSSDVRDTVFDRADLTDCVFSTVDLSNASFNQAIMVRTAFSLSSLGGARFTGVTLVDARMTTMELRGAIFEGCSFHGVDFKECDLDRHCFDGQTFIGVRFDKTSLKDATFRNAIIKNVSFIAPIVWSKKFYKAVRTICFDGAAMDKLTYAALKGMDADLSKVTMI